MMASGIWTFYLIHIKSKECLYKTKLYLYAVNVNGFVVPVEFDNNSYK